MGSGAAEPHLERPVTGRRVQQRPGPPPSAALVVAEVLEVDGPVTAALDVLSRAAVDALPAGVVVRSSTGEVVLSNPAAASMLGISSDRLGGRTSDDLRLDLVDADLRSLPHEDRPASRCLRTGEAVLGFTMGRRLPEGDVRWFRTDAVPLRDGEGQVVGVVSLLHDLAADWSAGGARSGSEQQLLRSGREGRVGTWEWHLPTNRVWHDEGFVHVMDGARVSDPEEWLRSIHPDDAARVAENIGKLAAGAPVRPEITYRIEMRGRPVRWLVSHIDVVERDEAGRAVVLAGTIAEATELQQANAQVARLLDDMTDGYLTVTTDGRIGYVNRRAAELVGMTREELVGVALVDAFPGAVVNGVSTLIARAMEGEAVQAEAHFAPLDQWFDVRANPLPEGVAVYFHDVTDRHRAEEERGRLLARAEQASRDLAHAATHDPLTDLPNRAALAAWLERSHARSTDRAPLSLLFIDLDRFKLVNDSHGHAEGDALLVEAGRRLRRVVRPGDLVVRLGGDEFVVAVDGLDELDAVALAERVVQAFREPFQVADRRLVVTSSVGIAFAGPGATPETLIRDADAALYQAKDAGRNRTGIFDDEVRQRAIARIGIEADLRDLLEVGGLGAHFQPSFDLATGVVVGVEALARWDHPVRGPVPPTDFIPVAEETGLVVEVGEAMLELAIAAVEQLDRCAEVAGASIWVNVSVRQLDDPGFADRLVARLQRCGALHRIGVEVTESALARDAATGAAALRDLSAAGIELAIDDFGTGWSSLGRLVERPVEVLKVDRSFLDGIGSEAGMRVVAAIIDLAHAIGAEAWAEGVETEDQLARLRTLGVDKVSGYLLCPPVPLDDLATGAAAGRRLLDQDRDRGLPTRR